MDALSSSININYPSKTQLDVFEKRKNRDDGSRSGTNLTELPPRVDPPLRPPPDNEEHFGVVKRVKTNMEELSAVGEQVYDAECILNKRLKKVR